MSTPEKIWLYRPWIEEDEVRAVTQVLRSGMLHGMVQVELFEQELARYIGCNHVVCCSSGTAALHLALIAAGIGAGDEVIVPAFTFPATAQIPLLVGAKPVFADVEYYTWNLRPQSVEEAVTDRTRAIIPVSAFGLPYDMEAIRAIADRHSTRQQRILVVGDDAGALGAKYMGTKVGAAMCDLHDGKGGLRIDEKGVPVKGRAEDITCFSFHTSKVLTTGEGGCLCTDNSEWAARARIVMDHGSLARDVPEPHRRFRTLGYNLRMTDLQAALGRVQLQKLDEMVLRRRQLAGDYTRLIAPLNPIRELTPMKVGGQTVRRPDREYVVSTPYEAEGVYQSFQRYVIFLEKHDGVFVRNELRRRGVDCTFGYYDVPDEPFAADAGIYKRCPNARLFHRKTVALPLYHTLTFEDQKRVVETLRQVLDLPAPPPTRQEGESEEKTPFSSEATPP